MNDPCIHPDLERLLAKLMAEELDAAEQEQLNRILADDDASRLFYRKYLIVDALLRWENAPAITVKNEERATFGGETINLPSPLGRGAEGDGGQNQPQPALTLALSQRESGPDLVPASAVANPLPPPCIVLDSSPLLSPLAPLPFYVAHPFLFSNFFALLVMGIGLAGAWMYQIDIPQPMAKEIRHITPTVATNKTDDLEFVGQVTGIIDVRWADVQTATVDRANVPLGRKYALASGLMEITYKTGAKVVLQGPCNFDVNSRDGGFLAAGKLTARVDSAKPQSANHHSLPSPRCPLFTIKTPAVTITDLGTEFSVDVRPDRSTVVHVIRGIVETTRDNRTGGSPVCERLVAGEAIRFASLTESPKRISGQVSHTPLPPDLRAAVQQTNKARASHVLLMPTGLVATAYHRVSDASGKLAADNDRQLAFRVTTDGLFGRGEKNAPPTSSFDTCQGAGIRGQGAESAISPAPTSFVGLLYNRPMRFDRIKVFLGRQMGDGGNWASMPRVFILKKPVDTDRTAPESDPTNWRELRLDQLFYGNSFDAKPDANPGAVLEFLLTSFSEEQRTGYGWALGGAPGDGPTGYVSVTELRGYGIELQQQDKDAVKGGSGF